MTNITFFKGTFFELLPVKKGEHFMTKRTKYTAEEKYAILNAYDNGIGTIKEIANKYKINRATFYNWRYSYSKFGIDRLRESKTFKGYSKEIKELAVKDYISGDFSQREVVNKYKISNISVLQRWTNKYNGHREIKATTKGMSQSMTKGRVTSLKERMKLYITVLLKTMTIYKLLRFIMYPTSKYTNGLKNMNLVTKMH